MLVPAGLLAACAGFAAPAPSFNLPTFQLPPPFATPGPTPEQQLLARERAQQQFEAEVAAAKAQAAADRADRTARELLCATVGLDRGALATEAQRISEALAKAGF